MKYKMIFLDEKKAKAYRYGRIFEMRINGKKIKTEHAIAGFYEGLSLKDYPKFLNDTDNRVGAYTGEYSFYIGPLLDEGINLSKNEVILWTSIGSMKMRMEEFRQLNMHFAHKAIEGVTWFKLKERGKVNDEWIESIKKWILDHELV